MTNKELQITLLARREAFMLLDPIKGNYRKGVSAVLIASTDILIDINEDMKAHQQSIWKTRTSLKTSDFSNWPEDSIDPDYQYVKGKVDALLKYLNCLRELIQSQ